MPLDGFTESTFSHDGQRFPVFRRGTGPGVVVIHEVPGLTDAVIGFARHVADAGFTVALPQLFGRLRTTYTAGPIASAVLHACISREFAVLSRGRRSPITDALRALARQLHDELGGPGVGAIGMCLTGNFALAMFLEPAVVAPVLSQPSLPFGLSAAHRADPAVSPDELARVAQRCEDEDRTVLGLRFSHDPLCPAARFHTLREALGDRFEAVEIDSGPGNPWGLTRMAHSVVTRDLVDEEGHPTVEARDRVLAFFAQTLGPGSDVDESTLGKPTRMD